MGLADIICTGRDEPPIHPVKTEIAFAGFSCLFVEDDRLIGAGINACGTSRARFMVKDDNPVISFCDRFNRTSLGAWRSIAVEAYIHPENKINFFVDRFRAVFHDGDIFYAVRSPVFLLTGHFAGFTPPTGLVIDKKYICFHNGSSLLFSG
jgi:hypothetical protein